jgi:hypothetical protein
MVYLGHFFDEIFRLKQTEPGYNEHILTIFQRIEKKYIIYSENSQNTFRIQFKGYVYENSSK